SAWCAVAARAGARRQSRRGYRTRRHRARRCGRGPRWRSARAWQPGSHKKVPPHMAPTEGELDIAALGEFGIGAVSVDLQLAAEAGKMLGRPHMLAVGGIGIGDAWRVGAGPRPFVAGIGPQLPFLGASTSGIG